MPIGQAVPTSLLVVAGTAAAGVLPRLRRGRWPVAGVFGAAGAGAAFGGAAVNLLLPERALLGAFAALMLVVGVQLLRRQPEPHGACEAPGGASIGGPACPRRCWSARQWAFSPGCSVSAAGSSSCPP
jgi:Predicted permeases